MKHATKFIALSLATALAATFSVSAMAQKTQTFDEAAAALQAKVTKNCGKGYNKEKFLLVTITGADVEKISGMETVTLVDDDKFSGREPETLGFLRPKATAAQAKSLIGKKMCVAL